MKCQYCNKNQPKSEYLPSSSPFWKEGHINVCHTCLEELVDFNDLNQIDRVLQFANMAFLPGEWRKIYKREEKKALRKYGQLYWDFNYYKYDWGEQNKKLMSLAENGLAEVEIEELKPGLLRELKLRWGEMDELDLLTLERYYNSILGDYDVNTEAQRDMFRKICRLSLAIDKDLQANFVDKDKIAQYEKLMASVLKMVEKTQSDAITSIGQVIEFIERNGYKANFYDGLPRDEIDLIMKNTQEFLRDLIMNEVSLPEVYSNIKRRLVEGEEIEENPDIKFKDVELEDGDIDEGFLDSFSGIGE